MNEANRAILPIGFGAKRLIAIGFLGVLAVIVGIAWMSGWFSRSSDAEITGGSPIRNVRQDVKFVGDAKCARCHPEIAQTYREHPMGRSLTPVKDAKLPLGGSYPQPSFVAQGNEYSLEFDGDRLIQQEARKNADGKVIAEHKAEARFVIGSSEQAIAFLLDRDGYLFESPMTWFSRKNKWDLSPGYERDNVHFDRFVKTECLFCHSNRFDQVSGTENRYREPIFQGHAIGCERCHGPGELHVKHPEANDNTAPNIVNPARLEPALRESVCQQCHLQGDIRIVRAGRRLDEYRPGLPLHRFESIFVKNSTQGNARFFGQVEQMYESRCFQASQGAMGCISCHDPHALPSPKERVEYYRGRCMECHNDKGCRLPREERLEKNRDDSCIDCHMPRSTNEQIPHTATTLHLISRFGLLDDPRGAPAPRANDGEPLVHFHQNLLDSKERDEVQRDLGIALAEKSRAIPGMNPVALNRKALPLIEASLAKRPDDPPAWEGKGNALWNLGRREESLAAFRTALAKAPDQEATLVATASRAAQMGRLDDALSYWNRAIAINPWRSDYHHVLSLVHTQRADWTKAAEAARKAIELNPFNTPSRMLLVQSLLKTRQNNRAVAEFQIVLELDPPDRDQLQSWFSKLYKK